MKKLLLFLLFNFAIGFAIQAQDDKVKVKKTSTLPQKVQNTFSKKKHYKGHKTKHKHNGHVQEHEIDVREGEEKTKVK